LQDGRFNKIKSNMSARFLAGKKYKKKCMERGFYAGSNVMFWRILLQKTNWKDQRGTKMGQSTTALPR
jgi:hypothetical protein